MDGGKCCSPTSHLKKLRLLVPDLLQTSPCWGTPRSLPLDPPTAQPHRGDMLPGGQQERGDLGPHSSIQPTDWSRARPPATGSPVSAGRLSPRWLLPRRHPPGPGQAPPTVAAAQRAVTKACHQTLACSEELAGSPFPSMYPPGLGTITERTQGSTSPGRQGLDRVRREARASPSPRNLARWRSGRH